MYGMVIIGLFLVFCEQVQAFEHGITVSMGVKKFAEDNLEATAINALLKRRHATGGSSRFIEEEVKLEVIKQKIKDRLDYEFFTDEKFLIPYYTSLKYGQLPISQWVQLRKREAIALEQEVRSQVEKEFNRCKKENKKKVGIYVSCFGTFRFLEKKRLKKLGICAICCEKNQFESTVATTQCEKPHLFHSACMNRLVESNEKNDMPQVCPLCRSNLEYKFLVEG